MSAPFEVRSARRSDAATWAQLRSELWPDEAAIDADADLDAAMLDEDAAIVFVADVGGEMIAFAEATLRHDYVNGTASSPVGFLEGWYVVPEWRGRGVGRALLQAVEAWARELGCVEIASDSLLDNTASHAAHASCGFEETERVVYFRKSLDAP